MSRGTAQGDKPERGDVGHDLVDVKFIGHRSHSKLDKLLYAHCPPQFVRQQLLAPTERIKLLAFGQAQTDQPGKWAAS